MNASVEIFDWHEWKKVLVVVAHPDDPEYGLSAAVREWTDAGVEVAYLLLTRGEAGIQGMDPAEVGPLRVAEQHKACAEVGVTDLQILDHPDSMLVYSLELRRDIARAIRKQRPDAVIVPNFDVEAYGGLNQADHRVAGLATIDGTRDAANPWAQRELLDEEGLEPWSTAKLLVAGVPNPTHIVPVSSASVAAGVASLQAHVDYLKALPENPEPEVFIPEVLAQGAELVDDPSVESAMTFRVFEV